MPETQKQDSAEGLLRLDVAVDSIVVGDRHRQDLGDIDALATSIEQLGLLQPITVTPDMLLVCGYRRLIAIQRLGWATTRPWVRRGISSRLQEVLAERDEEQLRKPLDDVEAAQLYREIKELLAEDAARRQATGRFGANGDARTTTNNTPGQGDEVDIDGGANLAPPRDLRERTRAQAARMVTGKASYTRLDRIAALSDIADDTTRPDRIRIMAADALEQVRQGASVFPLYDRVRAELAAVDPRAQAVEPVGQDEVAEVVAAAVERLTRPAPETNRTDESGGHPVKGRHSLRAWALLWQGMDGWWEHYDPADVGAGADDTDWAVFERVLDQTSRFAAAARAARDQAEAARRDRTET
ncbi:ParB family chromosome partitioning protein [Promicromonospora sp. AC04]|uniref:ParB N-terminal domain-containing protein n=1 Tax=Promicromonospora sp. AC04 TaxID=2135723 RepID=UPI000D36BAA9|nr:ParB N-terminal domain-containing protein [Promicromonospora sp. AC04]PUB20863.1 ParB family chromosome partitioning protein [Promicromonospora sp. AC04]